VNDHDAVRAVALDYFEGFYDADLARVDRAMHPELVKRTGFQVEYDPPRVTTKQMMLDFVRGGGGAEDKTEDPIEVTVVDVHHDIATVVVRSAQYREYLHLLRTTSGWKIVHAFWQLTDPDAAGSA
jgi:hypothetical protein